MPKRGPYLRKPLPKGKPKPITHKIREWREYFAMSQEDLAGESDLSVASISAYESGKNDPSFEALQKLSKALGIPRGMIIDIDPNDAPGKNAYLRIPPRPKG